MHPVWLLALFTLVAVLGGAFYVFYSNKRNRETGGKTSGIGGPNDPMAGANSKVRSGPELTASLNAAAEEEGPRPVRTPVQ